jgi:hypothetical protein
MANRQLLSQNTSATAWERGVILHRRDKFVVNLKELGSEINCPWDFDARVSQGLWMQSLRTLVSVTEVP